MFLIVVGVLIALAGNALWSYRQDRKRERGALQQLLEATRSNEQRIMQALYEDSVALVYTNAVLDGTRPGAAIDNRRMNEALYLSLWFSDLRLETGTYSAVAQTGDLALLRNERLRANVSSYAGELGSLMLEWSSVADGSTLGVLRDTGALFSYRNLMLWAAQTHDTVPPPVDIVKLRNDRPFQSYLDFKFIASGARLGLLTPLRDRSAQLRSSLEDELRVAHRRPPPLDTTYHQIFVQAMEK